MKSCAAYWRAKSFRLAHSEKENGPRLASAGRLRIGTAFRRLLLPLVFDHDRAGSRGPRLGQFLAVSRISDLWCRRLCLDAVGGRNVTVGTEWAALAPVMLPMQSRMVSPV